MKKMKENFPTTFKCGSWPHIKSKPPPLLVMTRERDEFLDPKMSHSCEELCNGPK